MSLQKTSAATLKVKWLARKSFWNCGKGVSGSVYGFIDIEGNRKHQRVVLIVGKKNGKSLLGSIMGNYGLFADGEAVRNLCSSHKRSSKNCMVRSQAYG